jgi:hypothetical protein
MKQNASARLTHGNGWRPSSTLSLMSRTITAVVPDGKCGSIVLPVCLLLATRQEDNKMVGEKRTLCTDHLTLQATNNLHRPFVARDSSIFCSFTQMRHFHHDNVHLICNCKQPLVVGQRRTRPLPKCSDEGDAPTPRVSRTGSSYKGREFAPPEKTVYRWVLIFK